MSENGPEGPVVARLAIIEPTMEWAGGGVTGAGLLAAVEAIDLSKYTGLAQSGQPAEGRIPGFSFGEAEITLVDEHGEVCKPNVPVYREVHLVARKHNATPTELQHIQDLFEGYVRLGGTRQGLRQAILTKLMEHLIDPPREGGL